MNTEQPQPTTEAAGGASDVERVVRRLREACTGHPNAVIPWPHRLLHDAADAIERLAKDAERIDWLADPSNVIGNIQLPTHCVTANLHSLRGAIDMAMQTDTTPNRYS